MMTAVGQSLGASKTPLIKVGEQGPVIDQKAVIERSRLGLCLQLLH